MDRYTRRPSTFMLCCAPSKGGKTMHRKPSLFVLCLFATVVCASNLALAQTSHRNLNPGVIPINGHYAGLSYGEWSARWWQWFWANLTPSSPVLDDTGANALVGQSGQVWFLAWHLTNPATVRNITIPTGKALLFPATNHDSLFDLP